MDIDHLNGKVRRKLTNNLQDIKNIKYFKKTGRERHLLDSRLLTLLEQKESGEN